MTAEEWRPIPGFNDWYEVSNLGNVRSWSPYMKGKPLKPTPNAKGYLRVGLRTADGRSRWFYVHRLVLEAHVGPCPDGMQGAHGDGNPANNKASNLRWATQSENNLDAVRHGTHVDTRKTHCPQGHPYDEENTYRTPEGYRRCRACTYERRSNRNKQKAEVA